MDNWSAWRSEEHTSELQSHSGISYAVFCLKKNTGRGLRRRRAPLRPRLHDGVLPIAPQHAHGRLLFFFNETPTTEIYTPLYTLSLHDALPIFSSGGSGSGGWVNPGGLQRICSERSEEHTSELQSHSGISYAVFCLKKKNEVCGGRRHDRSMTCGCVEHQ